jgi:hypothetical protein
MSLETYSHQLLKAFGNSDGQVTDVDKLAPQGFDKGDPQFRAALDLLYEEGLIRRSDNGTGLGYTVGMQGAVGWAVTPLTLTSSGRTAAFTASAK